MSKYKHTKKMITIHKFKQIECNCVENENQRCNDEVSQDQNVNEQENDRDCERSIDTCHRRVKRIHDSSLHLKQAFESCSLLS